MIGPPTSEPSQSEMGCSATHSGHPLWYVAYTSANHEKRVAEQFSLRSVEHFLPLYEAKRRWKDRRMKLELPLFPGYVFVRMSLRDRLKVLQVPGVARLVGFNGQPAAIPDNEIEALRASLGAQLRAEPHPYLIVGRRVWPAVATPLSDATKSPPLADPPVKHFVGAQEVVASSAVVKNAPFFTGRTSR